MVKISGWVFLSIGGLFSGLSLYINKSQKTNSMTMFLYFGYLFIAYGIAKILVSYIMRKDSKSTNKQKNRHKLSKAKVNRKNSNNQHLPSYNTENQYQSSQGKVDGKNSNNNQTKDGYIGYCKRCGTPMRELNTYCHRCGMKQ